MKKGISVLIMMAALNLYGQYKDSLLNQYFFESGLAIQDTTGFEMVDAYLPSNSYWAIDSFTEETVFHRAMIYTDDTDSTASYALRIGKGGQIYSLIGAFGESVPPQYRPTQWVQDSYGGGTSYAPWVDEVWQMVSVDGSLNNPPDSSYFIHQSGVYLKTPNQQEPFFSPIVGSYYNADDRSFSIINWGQQAHTEDLLNVDHQSGLLYYSKYKHIGHGVIEVDQMIYNFGTDNMNFINVPWGGVRNSSLDHFFISAPDHAYNLADAVYGQGPVVQTATTGGWMGWSDALDGNSPVLFMVHPTTTVSNNNVFRYGSAGANPSNPRDYNVFEMIRFPSAGQLDFGKCMSFRYYYVLAANIEAVKTKILDLELNSFTMDAAYTPPAAEVGDLEYQFAYQMGQFDYAMEDLGTGLMLKQSPFEGSYPVFLLTAADSMQYISSDPYYLSSVAYDGHTVGLELLGFYNSAMELVVQNDTICAGASFTFPDGSMEVNINQSLSHISTLEAIGFAGDSLILSNVEVIHLDTAVVQMQDTLIAQAEGVMYQWLDCDAGAALSGDTLMHFVPSTSGTYALEISNGTCVDTSSCFSFIPTLIGPVDMQLLTSISPNPSTGSFHLIFSDRLDKATCTLYDAIGVVLEKRTISNQAEVYFDLNLPPGLYIMTIHKQGFVEEKWRLIIED